MKRIRNTPQVLNIFGEPLVIPERDEGSPRCPQCGWVIENCVRCGTSISKTRFVNVSLALFIKGFLANIRVESMEDAERVRDCAQAVMKALRNGDSFIEFSDGDYRWLQRMVESSAPRILGINASILREALSQEVPDKEG